MIAQLLWRNFFQDQTQVDGAALEVEIPDDVDYYTRAKYHCKQDVRVGRRRANRWNRDSPVEGRSHRDYRQKASNRQYPSSTGEPPGKVFPSERENNSTDSEKHPDNGPYCCSIQELTDVSSIHCDISENRGYYESKD